MSLIHYILGRSPVLAAGSALPICRKTGCAPPIRAWRRSRMGSSTPERSVVVGKWGGREPPCKPDPVPRPKAEGAIISLGPRLPAASNDQPGNDRWGRHPFPYSVFLRAGFTLPGLSPGPRCALTAPFHPYPTPRGVTTGGLFSVALSLASRPVAVSNRSGPWSPDFPRVGSLRRAIARRARVRRGG